MSNVLGSSLIWTSGILNICCCFLQTGEVEKKNQNSKIRHIQIDGLPRTQVGVKDFFCIITNFHQELYFLWHRSGPSCIENKQIKVKLKNCNHIYSYPAHTSTGGRCDKIKWCSNTLWTSFSLLLSLASSTFRILLWRSKPLNARPGPFALQPALPGPHSSLCYCCCH